MKTIETASKEQAYNFVHNNVDYSHPNFVANEKKQSFEDGVAFGQRWIPIEEELPTIHVDVILKCESGFWDKGCLIHQSGDNMFSSSSGDLDIVTHWRPISFL